MSYKVYNNKSIFELPKAVIFDTDNTLYPYLPAHKAASKALAVKANKLLGIPIKLFNSEFEKARKEIKLRLGSNASSHSRLLYIQRTIELLGVNSQLLLTLDLEQTYWRTFLQTCNLYPGIKELLLKLQDLNITTAIITDLTSQIQFRKIIFFGLEDFFDFIVTSEESGFDKPNNASFKLAIEKLGICPSKCWMIGDNLNADIKGANDFGLISIHKNENNRNYKYENIIPDISFDNFSSLINLISKVEKGL
ncbi:HAD-IA family hydrolase [Prochlorococcus marinus XMU1412]|uniref:HAD family hydrolase n=1 Tax=Prochlorococcus marinus TaxID=1219 RepID=UPI001ADB135C|nr:HAD-IA family hydrolase [Prochlorococcus marinus]MBO8240539.1 HAD-IA family hydrolase [Prochlorococcus marinus XMU1412]MBW3071774.1 hydrolase [Prochlorococcus marinus str. MU1412]